MNLEQNLHWNSWNKYLYTYINPNNTNADIKYCSSKKKQIGRFVLKEKLNGGDHNKSIFMSVNTDKSK